MRDLHGEQGQGWIGVDLDGTLARYDGWKGPTHIGAPIGPMVNRVFDWIAQGKTVKVFTARVHPAKPDAAICRGAIKAWLIEVFGRPFEITHEKDPEMAELWDDRVVQVVPNLGVPMLSQNHCCPRRATTPTCFGCDLKR